MCTTRVLNNFYQYMLKFKRLKKKLYIKNSFGVTDVLVDYAGFQ